MNEMLKQRLDLLVDALDNILISIHEIRSFFFAMSKVMDPNNDAAKGGQDNE